MVKRLRRQPLTLKSGVRFSQGSPGYSSLAQSVEHAAVNRRVVGASPTGGAKKTPPKWVVFLFISRYRASEPTALRSSPAASPTARRDSRWSWRRSAALWQKKRGANGCRGRNFGRRCGGPPKNFGIPQRAPPQTIGG